MTRVKPWVSQVQGLELFLFESESSLFLVSVVWVYVEPQDSEVWVQSLLGARPSQALSLRCLSLVSSLRGASQSWVFSLWVHWKLWFCLNVVITPLKRHMTEGTELGQSRSSLIQYQSASVTPVPRLSGAWGVYPMFRACKYLWSL